MNMGSTQFANCTQGQVDYFDKSIKGMSLDGKPPTYLSNSHMINAYILYKYYEENKGSFNQDKYATLGVNGYTTWTFIIRNNQLYLVESTFNVIENCFKIENNWIANKEHPWRVTYEKETEQNNTVTVV